MKTSLLWIAHPGPYHPTGQVELSIIQHSSSVTGARGTGHTEQLPASWDQQEARPLPQRMLELNHKGAVSFVKTRMNCRCEQKIKCRQLHLWRPLGCRALLLGKEEAPQWCMSFLSPPFLSPTPSLLSPIFPHFASLSPFSPFFTFPSPLPISSVLPSPLRSLSNPSLPWGWGWGNGAVLWVVVVGGWQWW